MARESGASRTVAQNRKARHDYSIEDTVEAGIMLTGSEVKTLRLGQGSIAEAFAQAREGDIWLVNAHIPEYASAKHFGHEPRRPRKLLLHKREIEKLAGAVKREGITLVPLALYFNPRGKVKLSLGIAKGKRQVDKRASEKARDWSRERARLLRDRG